MLADAGSIPAASTTQARQSSAYGRFFVVTTKSCNIPASGKASHHPLFIFQLIHRVHHRLYALGFKGQPDMVDAGLKRHGDLFARGLEHRLEAVSME